MGALIFFEELIKISGVFVKFTLYLINLFCKVKISSTCLF